MTTIYPVIMCGGSGTRLWPLSRRAKAKQYHALTSSSTMLQEAIERMQYDGVCTVARPSFVCAASDEDNVSSQSEAIGVKPLTIILEPMGRNTAAVAAIISLIMQDKEPDDLILLLPADHHIEDKEAFWQYVASGVKTAVSGHLVTLGIKPEHPETGFGYILRGAQIDEQVYTVKSFVEKPDLEKAKSYLDSGDYFWNAGIFLFSPKVMIDSFKLHEPEVLSVCEATLVSSEKRGTTLALDGDQFIKCPKISIDYAIMEPADNVAMVAPVDVGWNDIGSWPALAALLDKANVKEGNGDCIEVDCTNSYLRSDGPLIAGIGLENMIVIATKDAILVMPKDRAQSVKDVVDILKKSDKETLY